MTTTNKEALEEVLEEEVWVDIEQPVPYPLNSKIHSEENIRALMKSISTQTMFHPILLDKNMVIISGHGRLQACKRLGFTKIRAVIKDKWTDDEVKAARIADNKTASTEYDSSILVKEIKEINPEDQRLLDSLGIPEAELNRLLIQPDEVDLSAFTQNLDEEVDRQAKEGERDISKADLKLVSVTNGLGFSKVTAFDSRKIARFVASLQDQFAEQDPATALLKFIDELAV